MIRRPSDEQVIEAYERLQSCWKAGPELGIAAQTVHKRLRKAGYVPNPIRVLTDGEKEEIRAYYVTTPPELFCLADLAKKLGREKSTVCLVARRMGLTKRRPHNAEVRARQGATISEKWKQNGHPRGALGMVHSEAARAKISAASKQTWALSKTFGIMQMAPEVRDVKSQKASQRMAAQSRENVHSRAAGGRSEDLGEIWFRSSWERNYARYLNLLVKMKLVDGWQYEPETFWFEGVRRGTLSYKPDFRILYRNDPRPEYVEIKGWVTPKDRTKWKRMAKYHPKIKLVVIAAKEYRQIENKWASALPNWERGVRAKPAFAVLMGKQVGPSA